ncbi:hypothetical protein [uncultured Veillonella sp.]|uniref:hypothetical protein n=1 Tax=uncultured Veillonella sp. TaxID=159268 RepID=UPI002582857A|nr:hypothetical protein [uncultured Veillonella sp.]
MRNNFAGTCYFCGKKVYPREGHFEKNVLGVGTRRWLLIHAECVFKQRKLKEKYGNALIRELINKRIFWHEGAFEIYSKES